MLSNLNAHAFSNFLRGPKRTTSSLPTDDPKISCPKSNCIPAVVLDERSPNVAVKSKRELSSLFLTTLTPIISSSAVKSDFVINCV